MSKMSMLAAGAVGYVLGARAGRERYEQIAAGARRVWTSPRVQQASHDAANLAREKAPVVGQKLAGAAKSATGGSDSGEPATTSSDGYSPTAASSS
jgi:SLT domain-containing protein